MAKFPGSAEVRVSAHTLSVVHVELAYSDSAATYTVPVKAGTFVHQIGTVVKTAFDATTPSLKVGDGSDDDGFLDSTDIALATAATATTPAIKLMEDSGNPYANGKYYASDDTIDFVFDPGTSGTTGLLKAFVVISNVKNDGLDA